MATENRFMTKKTEEIAKLVFKLDQMGASVMLNMHIDSPNHDAVATPIFEYGAIQHSTINLPMPDPKEWPKSIDPTFKRDMEVRRK